MTERSKNGFFYRLVFSSLDRLEKMTDGSRPWRAVLGIVLVGSVLTLLLCISLWNTSFHREQLAFRAVASQIQAQTGDRLMYRRWMLVHAADRWSQGPLPPSSAGSGFAPGELVAIRPGDEVAQLMGWQKLAEPSRSALQRFWQQDVAAASPYDEPLMSPALRNTSNHLVWLMVQPAKAERADGQPAGWLVTMVDDSVVLPLLQDVAGWQMRARLEANQDASHTGRADHEWLAALGAQEGNSAPVLLISGQVRQEGWMSWLARYASVWISAVAGALTTLGALYAYVVLISIRLRAQALARKNTVELQRSESRNRAVVDTAPDAIITVDDRGLVQWCNQATVSIFGQNLDDLRGKPLSAVVPALDGRSMQEWFRDHGIANRVLSFECKGRRAEGTEFPIAVSASRSELDKDVINTFIVRDTTDAKWAEQELLLRERALESSEDAVFITDMFLPGQPIIFANPAFERITGYEVHEVLGHNCRFLQRDDREQPAIATMRVAIEQGRPCQVVLRNYRKDGSLFWNELTISPVRGQDEKVSHYVGIASDITDRIAAEQVLNLRTERLNAVFDLSPDGFVVLDKRGELSIVNPAFERMTGLDASTLVGQSLDAFEEHLMSLCSSVEQDEASGSEADGGMPGSRRELLHLHSPTHRTLVRRTRNGGHDNETVMYFRDITHELEVDRMKSEFLSMAAHELRTPMASIFGFTELLLKRKFDDTRRQDMLSTIHRQASILINLVNELLDLARIESRRGKDFKRKRQTLQPIIDGVIGGLLIHNDDRKVMLSLPPTPIEVDVDAEKLSLAITNVVSNAYKYSPQGGDIDLDLVWRDRDGHSECGIRVTDHGIGMTEDQLARVFERFFRADTSGNIPGTGLGMTIVKEIVELHGGQVSLSSQFGVGTTVVLWVPVLGQPAAAPSEDLATTP